MRRGQRHQVERFEEECHGQPNEGRSTCFHFIKAAVEEEAVLVHGSTHAESVHKAPVHEHELRLR